MDLKGKVALVTGGARGQGRSHAVALAAAGAKVAVLDVDGDIEAVPYPLATEADMAETGRQISEAASGEASLPLVADVRNRAAVAAAVERTIAKFGSLDIVIANHGVMSIGQVAELEPAQWDAVIGVNLTGTFNVIRAALPHVLRSTGGGRVVITSSMAAKGGYPHFGHYAASKWGLIGLAKTLALEVATTGTTVNVICPCIVDTPIVHNEAMYALFRPDLESPTREDVLAELAQYQPQGVPFIAPSAITDAVMFLVSDGARHITGETISVAAGQNALGAA